MFKKLVAGMVIAGILSTGGVALAQGPHREPSNGICTRVRIITGAEDTWSRPNTFREADCLERLEKKAEALGIDPAGLSLEELRSKVHAAIAELRNENRLARLQQKAEAAGIDTTDLTLDEIKAKFRDAMVEKNRGKGLGRGL